MKAALASVAVVGGLAAMSPLLDSPTQTSAQSIDNKSQDKGPSLPWAAGTLPPRGGIGVSDGETNYAGSLVAATPFHHTGNSLQTGRAAECLAAAAWYEAGDDAVGQRAVVQTVINRVKHTAFPDSVCGVVFEGSHLSTGCQFTFTCDGSMQRRRPSPAAKGRALKIARLALNGLVDETIGEATHYHADYVTPWWSSKLERLTSVGPHIFYKWRGRGGGLRDRIRLQAEADPAQFSRMTPSSITDHDDEITAPLANSLAPPRVGMSGLPGSARAAPSPNMFFVAVEGGQANGRWALDAMRRCQGRPDCQVLAYGSQDAANRNKAASTGNRSRPLFLFVKDRASGMELALWDCEAVQRPNERQCLPTDPAALARLLRNRVAAD